jgi:hypothetical protein
MENENKVIDKTGQEIEAIIRQIRYNQKFRFYNKHIPEVYEALTREIEQLDARFRALIKE